MIESMAMSRSTFTRRMIDGLYVEAMLLADEARSCFERDTARPAEKGGAATQISISCESLRVTTRLMHCIAWLLNQRAWFNGELSDAQLRRSGRALGVSQTSDPDVLTMLPDDIRLLVHASEDLYERIARLDYGMRLPEPLLAGPVADAATSPAHTMVQRLESAFGG